MSTREKWSRLEVLAEDFDSLFSHNHGWTEEDLQDLLDLGELLWPMVAKDALRSLSRFR